MFRRSDDAVMSRKTSSSAPSSEYRKPHSTGSPASRRFTKWMPFTTRPSFTSRHGMIRLASIGQRLFDFDAAFVKCLSDDHTIQAPMIEFGKMPHVRDRRHTARCDDGQICAFEHFLHGVNVRVFENAVPRNVGINDEARAQV